MSGIFHMMFNKIAAAIQAAFAVDLDGTNDYFSRSSDLTGNADGKTFTFSAWVKWSPSGTTEYIYTSKTGSSGLIVQITTSGQLEVLCYDTSTTQCIDALTTNTAFVKDTFTHILVSIDLSNTSSRHIYVNDVSYSSQWSTYNTSATIDFTQTNHYISFNGSSSYTLCSLANVFLDYTYRDLSNVTNRRLFITADRKPASGQAALNPIIYLPMDDPTTAHVNQGTGGNFTLNGTIARSGRGPNQYNVAYSDLDGAADYLSRTSLTGIDNSKTFTFACVLCADTVSFLQEIAFIGESSSAGMLQVGINASGILVIKAYSTSGAIILDAVSASAFSILRNYMIVVSVDFSTPVNRQVYINGEQASITWNTYTNNNIGFIGNNYHISKGHSAGFYPFDGRLGNVFFDTKYIDLSVPANLAKFVTGTGIDAKPADLGANGELPFGTAPLIYLPMYGNNAGKNYGSGGDFTVNSGPYPGARGPSEFWGNNADFDGSTGYLARTSALSGVNDGKTFSCSFTLYRTGSPGSTRKVVEFSSSAGSARWSIRICNTGLLYLYAFNSSGTTILDAVSTSTLALTTNYTVHICIDLSNSANRQVYVNETSFAMTWNTYTNASVSYSDAARQTIGAYWNGTVYGDFFYGKLSEFYFTTEYIDFSQEANRLKFRDAFGNPVYLGADGSLPTGTAPAIYMRFPPDDQGRNDGTGGDFVKSGTINDGGQL